MERHNQIEFIGRHGGGCPCGHIQINPAGQKDSYLAVAGKTGNTGYMVTGKELLGKIAAYFD